MTARKDQPAALKRRIALLEKLLQAEQERAEKAWEGYRKALYSRTDQQLVIDEIRAALERLDE